MNTTKIKKLLSQMLISLLAFAQTVEAASVTLASAPIANLSVTVVHPNVMYVLDNSGSMQWTYMPDYVSSGTSSTGSQICWTGTSDSQTRATCSSTLGSTGTSVQLPITASDINFIYYNPGITYQPPLKADGTSYDAASVTAAYSDGFAATGSMNFKNATTVATLTGTTTSGSTAVTGLTSSEGLVGTFVTGTGIPANTYVAAAPTGTSVTLSATATASGSPSLTFKSGGYGHQVFCSNSETSQQKLRSSASTCRETSDTSSGLLYPLTAGSFTTVKSYNGPAYYYTMSPRLYCTDNFYTDCQTSADGTHTVEALYRWCNSYTPAIAPSTPGVYNDCQDIRDSTHTIPDFLGSYIPGQAGNEATATLTISASPTVGHSITAVKLYDATDTYVSDLVAPGNLPITVASGNTATTIAQTLCTAIQSNSGFTGFGCPTAPTSGSLVIKATTRSDDFNGYTVKVEGPATVVGVASSGTLTINSTTGATVVNDITVNGVSVMTTKPFYFQDGTNTSAIATRLASLIGGGNYTGSAAGNIITITRTATGTADGQAIVMSATAISAKATITANSAVTASGGHIGAITAGATTLENAQSFAASASTTTVATQLRNNVIGASGFTATSASNVTTFTAPAGNAYNGTALSVAAGGISATAPTGTLTITDSGATKIDDITVNGVSILGTKPYFFGAADTASSICTKLATLVTANGFSATCASPPALVITAPTGTTYNAKTIAMTGTAVSAKATITSGAAVSGTQPGAIGAISAGATTLASAQTFAAGSSTTAVATQIASSIGNGFTATSSTNVATVTAPAGDTYNGVTLSIPGGSVTSAAPATGSVTLVSTAGATNIQQITANGTNLLSAALNFANGTSTSANATTLCAAIEAFKATSGYGCTTTSGAQVNIVATTNTSAKNGAIVVTTSTAAGSGPTAAISFSSVTVSSPGNVTITAGTNNTCSAGPAVTLFSGSLTTNSTSCSGSSSNAKRANRFTDLMFSNVAGSATATAGWTDASTSCSGTVTYTAPVGTPNATWFLCRNFTTPANFTATVASPSTTQFNGGSAAAIGQNTTKVDMAGGTAGQYNYSPNLTPGTFATPASGGNATATANAGYAAGASASSTMNSAGAAAIPNYATSLTAGTFPNASNGASGSSAATSNAGYAVQGATGSSLAGFVQAAGEIASNEPVTFAGGLDIISSDRVNLGKFTRIDIVPSDNSYTKAVGRSDCAGADCTYDEELQNFANWYSYYRSRMLMMKSASTIAFDELDSNFRVGFDLLSHYANSSVDLEVAQFVDSGGEVAGQRSAWWSNLTSATGSSGTPLRSSVDKIGRYYAGRLTTSAPIPAQNEVQASGTFTINSTTSNGAVITSITVEGVEILGTPITVAGCSSPCTSTQRRTLVATPIKNAINAHAHTPGYTASCGTGTGDTVTTCTTSTINITAPPVTAGMSSDPSDPATPTATADGQGDYFNGAAIAYTKTGTISIATTALSGGVNSAPAIPADAYEPIQYSCQQNYLLLVTDGYWNSTVYTDQKQLADADGNGSIDDPIGNQDSDLFDINTNPDGAVRGQYDGNDEYAALIADGTLSSSSYSTTCSDSKYSSCGTLADIAQYYYQTDLRNAALGNHINTDTSEDISENNVFVTPGDENTSQHMVFFGMGLGAPGSLRFRADYETALTGDYDEIVNGLVDAGTGNRVTDGSGNIVYKNWPMVKENDPSTIDDLWHATVNGHGQFFSARDPVSAANGLRDALFSITARVGSAAAAATSNLKPVAGDNFAYVASYETNSWVGDVQARTINLVTGAVDDGVDSNNNSTCGQPLDANGNGCPWSAQELLDSKVYTTRDIYLAPTSGTPGDPLRAFTYGNLTGVDDSSGEKAYFDPSTLNQYTAAVTSYDDPATLAVEFVTTENLVNFLRGDRSMERNGVAGQKQIWRFREHVLGDIVSTQPAFVKAPTFSYTDEGYADFKTDTDIAGRTGMLYINSNDGMLHALNAETGQEQWAFIPKSVLPTLKQLADKDYQHRYYVDGQIAVGDVDFNNCESISTACTPDWRTILVVGLGGGGKEYFALDVTEPAAPVFLWEITSADTNFENLGFTLGHASINKLPNGEWGVFFASGIQEVGGSADGHGYLYAVDPETGGMHSGYPLSTENPSVGDGDNGTAASPSNMVKIAARVTDVQRNNTAEFFYAGDMNGNVWRFDLDPAGTYTNPDNHTGTDVFKLAYLENADGVAQPVTTKPEMTLVGDINVIFISTGQYLSASDPLNTEVQSLYAIKDTLGADNITAGGGQVTWEPRNDKGTVNGVDDTFLFFQRTITNTTDATGTPVRTICDTGSINLDGSCDTPPTLDYLDYGGWYIDFPDTGERSNVDMNLTLGTLTVPTNVPNDSACNSGGYSWINYVDFKTGLAIEGENASNDQPIMGRKVEGALTVGINVVQLPGGALAAIVTTSDYRNVTVSPAFNTEVFTGTRDLWRELQIY